MTWSEYFLILLGAAIVIGIFVKFASRNGSRRSSGDSFWDFSGGDGDGGGGDGGGGD